MNVLVTGATGFVGSHVVDVLLERGHRVSYIARATSNLQWLEGKPAQRVDGSLSDVASLRTAVEAVDTVIHVAGLTAAKSESAFMVGNRDATQNLIDAVRTWNPNLRRFVHISSQAAVGPSRDVEHPADETWPLRPITAYGRSKAAAEAVVLEAGKDIPITIVRPPAVYGPRDTAVYTFFQAVNKGLATIIGFDDKRVSLIHGLDLARGIVLAAEHPAAAGETYFISSEETYTWPQIATLTAAVMGKRRLLRLRLPHPLVLGIAGVVGALGKLSKKPPVLDYEKGIDITQRYWTCSVEKARKELGFRQTLPIDDGLLDTVQWYRRHGWL